MKIPKSTSDTSAALENPGRVQVMLERSGLKERKRETEIFIFRDTKSGREVSQQTIHLSATRPSDRTQDYAVDS